MGKENQRPPASRFLFIITPLFPHCTPLSACVLCVLVGLYPSRLLRLDVFTTIAIPNHVPDRPGRSPSEGCEIDIYQ